MALLDRLSFLIDADASGAISEFRRVGNAARTDLGKAEAAQTGLGLSGRAAAIGVTVAGTAIAGLAAAALAGARNFIDSTHEVREFQRASGATARDASLLTAVFGDMEVDVNAASNAVFQLGKRIDTNGKQLAAHGIEVAHTASGTTDLAGTLLNVADAYESTEDQAKRNALVFDAFGRAGRQLIPVLEQGRAGLSEFFADAESHGQVFTQDEIDQAREYELALDDTGDAVGHLTRSLGSGLLPTIALLADGLATGVDWLADFVNWLDRSRHEVSEVEAAVDSMLDRFIAGEQAIDDTSSGISDLVNQYDDVVSSSRRLEDATSAVQEAFNQLAEDQRRSFAAEISRAEDDLTRARIGQERATERVADAQARLNELRRQDPAKLIADAQRRANDAATATSRALQDQVEAQDALNRLRDIGASPNEIRDAEIRVQETTNGVADAQAEAADAQSTLNDVRANGNSREIADAERDLRDAQLAARDSARNVTEATQKLNEKRDEARNRSQLLAEDERKLQRAIEDQAEAARMAAEKKAVAEGRAATAIQEGIKAEIDALGSFASKLGEVDPVIGQFVANRIGELQKILGVGVAALPPPLTGGPGLGSIIGTPGAATPPGGANPGLGGLFPTVPAPAPPPPNSGLGSLFPDAGPLARPTQSVYNVFPHNYNDFLADLEAQARLANVTAP